VPRQAALALDPDPRTPGRARRFVVETVRGWGYRDRLDTLELLTSELVTNGVLHARTPLDVLLEIDDDCVTVLVRDRDPRPPVHRGHRADLLADIDRLIAGGTVGPAADERHGLMNAGPAGSIGAGRGLLLVEALADAWGVSMEPPGKSVWFRLGVPRPR
jgi:hypothetical protein